MLWRFPAWNSPATPRRFEKKHPAKVLYKTSQLVSQDIFERTSMPYWNWNENMLKNGQKHGKN